MGGPAPAHPGPAGRKRRRAPEARRQPAARPAGDSRLADGGDGGGVDRTGRAPRFRRRVALAARLAARPWARAAPAIGAVPEVRRSGRPARRRGGERGLLRGRRVHAGRGPDRRPHARGTAAHAGFPGLGPRRAVNERSYVCKLLCYRFSPMTPKPDVVLYTLNNGTTDPT